MFIAGIDGGGTSTRLEIRDADNSFIRRESFGAFNISAIGADAFSARLDEVFAACGDMSGCAALCIGAAGLSLPQTERIIHRQLELAHFRGVLRLCGDHEIALRGAMDGAGCVLIAGTGSICFGVNSNGVSARCGGYGHILDDAGSGYAIGRDALRDAVRSADGRSEPSALSRAVLGRFPQGIGELIEYVYSKAGKADIASFAETVIECAAAGDETSLEILHREARELSELVQALSRRLGMARPRTALLGGLIASDNVYSGIVRRELEGTADVIPPAHDALWGAAQMAYEQTGA